MNRIQQLFERKKENILSIFITAGFPHLESLPEILVALEESGVDVVEIGMPFSDPTADGPVIQQSNNVAIGNGMTIHLLLEQLKDIRKKVSIPLVLMGYLNPPLQYGFDKFLEGPNAESFILADNKGGSLMIAPVDKGTVVKEDAQMDYLNKAYGQGTVCKSYEFSFDSDILSGEHGKLIMQTISAALMDMKIPDDVKKKVFKAKPILKLRKGLPEFVRTLGPKKGFMAISEIGMQFQVKNPKYNGEVSPVLSNII